MGARLLKAAYFAGCVFVLAGCGESGEPAESNSEGDIRTGTADIFVMRGAFEPVPVGEQGEVEVTVENRGDGYLLLHEVELVETSDDSVREFELSGWPADGSKIELDSGGEARFLLSYAPENRTPDAARISLWSNDPEDGVYTVEFQPELAQ